MRVALINMPFAALHLPSIALTQLREIVARELGDEVTTDTFYLNHELAGFFGLDTYRNIADSVRITATGFGDWLFRDLAFPDLADNAADYLARHGQQLAAGGIDPTDCARLRDDLGSRLDALIDSHALDGYDIVGFTSMFAQNAASIALARRLKARSPGLVTVIGGANCETSLGAVLARQVDVIDYVFSGPALKSFPQLLRHLRDHDTEACHRIPGVFSRRKLALATNGSDDEIGAELDIDTPLPLDYAAYLDSVARLCPDTQPSILFETSRGCWWGERSHCTFCGLNGKTMAYRGMNARLALEQFEQLFRYAPRAASFKSVDNIMPREYLKTVFPKLQPPPGATLFYELKSDVKAAEMEVLAAAGVTEVQPGIEALSTATLKLMGKGVSALQNIVFLKNSLVYGINPVWNLLIGFPGEEEAVYARYEAVLPKLVHLPPPTGVYPVRFDRFSPYHSRAHEYGLELKPYDFYAMVYPFPPDEIERMAYFFADRRQDSDYLAATARWIGRLDTRIESWLRGWRQDVDRPQLCFEWRRDTRVVCDTRTGERREYDVGELGHSLLAALDKPMRLSRLITQFDEQDPAAIEDRVERLCEQALLFEEDGRYVSLVVDTGRDSGYV